MAVSRWAWLGLLVLLPSLAGAQTNTDPCVSGGADTLYTGQAFTIKWTVQQQVPASDHDATMVAHRYNGFYLQIDTDAEVELPLTAEIGVCPAGTPRASDKVYAYRADGVKKGNHTLSIQMWNWAPLLNPDGTPILNPDGTPQYSTTQKLRGGKTTLPFAATDPTIPVLLGPPYGVFNPRVIK